MSNFYDSSFRAWAHDHGRQISRLADFVPKRVRKFPKLPRPQIMYLAGVGWIVMDQPRTSLFHWIVFQTKQDAYRVWILWHKAK